MAVVQKGKVTFSNFKPKTVQFSLYEKEPYRVGLFIGRATGAKEKVDDRTHEKYTALVGVFKAVIGHDADPSKPETLTDAVVSGVAYLPPAWQEQIEAALKESTAPGSVVEFVYEVMIGRRGEQDYEWIVRDLRPPTNDDPLASLMASAAPVAALPSPEADKPAKGKAA